MNTAGWVLTENGRQPWIVQGLMQTVDGVSPTVSATEIIISLVASSSIYVFARSCVDVVLMPRFATARSRSADDADRDR